MQGPVVQRRQDGLGIHLLCVLVAMFLGLQSAGSCASGESVFIERLDWLAGCWSAVGGESGSGESWTDARGGTLFGISRTVQNGVTVEHEFMEIRGNSAGRLLFIAHPSGQPSAQFELAEIGDGQVRFENPGHDFPQRISYRMISSEQLLAAIEGVDNGVFKRIEFPFRRRTCTGDTETDNTK